MPVRGHEIVVDVHEWPPQEGVDGGAVAQDTAELLPQRGSGAVELLVLVDDPRGEVDLVTRVDIG